MVNLSHDLPHAPRVTDTSEAGDRPGRPVRPVARCRVLGPVELTVRGTPAPPELLWRKHVALLVVLARSPGRKRTRDQLMVLLWGDKPQSAARHSLNEALRILRRHLGSDAVVTRGEDVHLDDHAIELDANEVDRLLAQGDATAAAALIGGEFMDGFTVPDAWDFEEWLAAERRAWHDRAVATLAESATGALASGSTVRAREFAERALRLDPLSETAVRPLMRAYALAGDRAAALNEFRRFTSALHSEYGIVPGAETETLARRISAERVWELPAPAAGASERDDTRSWPLVGRARELQTLLGQWSAGRTAARATACAIVGDPGMGKSRLAEEVLARARLDGALTVTTRATPGDRATRWSGLAVLDTADLPLPRTTPRDPAMDPLRHLLGSLPTRESPLAIFVDDAQWLDPDSVHALSTLLRDTAHHRVFLLLAVGPGTAPELDALLARVGREIDGAIVRIGPLDASALRELVQEALPEYDAAEHDRLVRRILADSAGVPFIANALLRAVTAGLDLHELGHAWPAPFRTLEQTLPAQLPHAVVAAIRVNFRRLSASAQQVLCAAAVSGEPATPEPIARVTELGAADLARALDELEWSRWLTSDARGYTFTARLLRTVVAEEMLTPGQRRRIAQALDII